VGVCEGVEEAVAMGVREMCGSIKMSQDVDKEWWDSHPVDSFLRIHGEVRIACLLYRSCSNDERC